jgi:hypothetical protein
MKDMLNTKLLQRTQLLAQPLEKLHRLYTVLELEQLATFKNLFEGQVRELRELELVDEVVHRPKEKLKQLYGKLNGKLKQLYSGEDHLNELRKYLSPLEGGMSQKTRLDTFKCLVETHLSQGELELKKLYEQPIYEVEQLLAQLARKQLDELLTQLEQLYEQQQLLERPWSSEFFWTHEFHEWLYIPQYPNFPASLYEFKNLNEDEREQLLAQLNTYDLAQLEKLEKLHCILAPKIHHKGDPHYLLPLYERHIEESKPLREIKALYERHIQDYKQLCKEHMEVLSFLYKQEPQLEQRFEQLSRLHEAAKLQESKAYESFLYNVEGFLYNIELYATKKLFKLECMFANLCKHPFNRAYERACEHYSKSSTNHKDYPRVFLMKDGQWAWARGDDHVRFYELKENAAFMMTLNWAESSYLL